MAKKKKAAAPKKAAKAKQQPEVELKIIPAKDIIEFAGKNFIHIKHTEGQHRSA